MRSTNFFVVVIALVFIACGGSDDLCSKLGTALNGFSTKATPCTQTPPAISFTAAQCNATLARCTDADKRIISSFTDCLNALPTCSTATQTTWSNQVQTCVNNANTLSANCR